MEREKNQTRAASHWLLQEKLPPLHGVSSCESLHEGHGKMQRFPWEHPKQTLYMGLRVSPWQFLVAAGSTVLLPALPVSSCFSLLHVSPFSFWEIVLSSLQLSTVANGHDFLDARECLASLSEKALMKQRPYGPWLWLIRALVLTSQFPLQALQRHRCYSSCAIFNPLPQALPESSSSRVFKSLNMRFKEVKPTLLLSGLWVPLPMLVPGCSARPVHTWPYVVWHTSPQTFHGLFCGTLGWPHPAQPAAASPGTELWFQKCSLWMKSTKGFGFLLDQLVSPALPKEGQSISHVSCSPFPVWIPLHPDTS